MNANVGKIECHSINKKDRVIYFDILRIIATFMVVMIHNISYDSSNFHLGEWSVLVAYDSITRWGVPVFVMISGALFLGREQSFRKVLNKNVFRIVSAFLFWSVFYTLWDVILIGETSSPKYIIMDVLRGHYHMWFLYMIICLYLLIPLLNEIIKHKKLANYYLILAFIFSFFIPQVITIIGFKSNFISESMSDILSFTHMNFVLGFSGYFVLGYLLNKLYITKKLEIIIYLMGICGLIFTIVSTIWIINRDHALSEIFYDSQTVNVLMMSIAVFVFAKQHFNKLPKSEKASDLISYISKCTLGVYLVHPFIIDCLDEFLGISIHSFDTIVSVLIITLLVFVCSLVISAILNKIPFVKKWFV